MSLRWWERHPRASRALLALAASCLALLLCEGLVRGFSLGPKIMPIFRDNLRLSNNPTLRFELIPGAPDGADRINSAGLRDREHALVKPPGVVRIACIGDSICYGYGVARQEAFPARLEARLLAAATQEAASYEVFNLGATGYDIFQSVENLAARGLPYSPDIVVYAYCLNDVDQNSIELRRLRNRMSVAESDFRERILGFSGSWLARHSRLWALGLFAWDSTTAQGQGEASLDLDPEWSPVPAGDPRDYVRRLYSLPAARRRLGEGLDRLAALSRAHGFRALVVIFPVFGNLAEYRWTDVHAEIAAAAAARSLPVLDLLPVYREHARTGEGGLSPDAYHPTAPGHELAAAAIAEALKSMY